jgi:hypothetical protein
MTGIVGAMLVFWLVSPSLAYRWRLPDRVLGVHYLR